MVKVLVTNHESEEKGSGVLVTGVPPMPPMREYAVLL
jgi:hypothetical protein